LRLYLCSNPHLLTAHIFFTPFRYFSFLTDCASPKACTILLRGPSKDILNEIDRNLADAMAVARNAVFFPYLAPGGGATEMAVSIGLAKKAKEAEGTQGGPYRAVADAMEVIPRTLIQNSGGNVIRVLTELRVRVLFVFVVFYGGFRFSWLRVALGVFFLCYAAACIRSYSAGGSDVLILAFTPSASILLSRTILSFFDFALSSAT
jgi:hypothetical protein